MFDQQFDQISSANIAIHPSIAGSLQPTTQNRNDQWEFQDPKMEVRYYHIRAYFAGDIP